MSIFGEKKSPFDKLVEAYNSMSDEEKGKFKASIEDIEKAEDEREIDKIEEEKADNEEVKDEKAEEKEEESQEIGEEIDKAEEKSDEIDSENEAEKHADVMVGLESRLKALEEKFNLVLSKDEEGGDFGASGFGKTTRDAIDEDNRTDDLVKKLGGRAY